VLHPGPGPRSASRTTRVYLDKGLTGTNRARPGLDQALAAVREGDTFTVTKLDRLARSVPDALAI
jgi:DNA invertase Pin-like site-specific DNA recombinase